MINYFFINIISVFQLIKIKKYRIKIKKIIKFSFIIN